jgi:hypothetical protein
MQLYYLGFYFKKSSWNKIQDNIVASRWIYLYILKYDARNHEPQTGQEFSKKQQT